MCRFGVCFLVVSVNLHALAAVELYPVFDFPKELIMDLNKAPHPVINVIPERVALHSLNALRGARALESMRQVEEKARKESAATQIGFFMRAQKLLSNRIDKVVGAG